MSENTNRNYIFIAIVGLSVALAIALVAGGIYYYVRPAANQPQDQAQSIDEAQQPRNVTPASLQKIVDEQLDSLNDNDFDQSVLSDEALEIN